MDIVAADTPALAIIFKRVRLSIDSRSGIELPRVLGFLWIRYHWLLVIPAKKRWRVGERKTSVSRWDHGVRLPEDFGCGICGECEAVGGCGNGAACDLTGVPCSRVDPALDGLD
ncbi:MAG: hypothetical protein VX453_13310 [Acidobacteriota bacterium]|nr:hypothetical protein [Acidobacteriota bacterium]